MEKQIKLNNQKEGLYTNKKNKLFAWFFIVFNSILVIFFFVYIFLLFSAVLAKNINFLDMLLAYNDTTTFLVGMIVIFSVLLSFIYSIFFSVYLYKQYKLSGNKLYLKFSYLVYIGYLQIFGLILGFVMLSKFSTINDDIILKNSTNDLKKNSIQRSIANLISILVLTIMILFHVFFNDFFNQYLSFTPLFVYSFVTWILFRNLIVHYIDLKEVIQNKKSLFANLVLVFLGQFWYFLK